MADRHRLTSSIIICLLLSGCNTNLPETRDQTDAAVYDIIDQAWQNDLGSQSNYKLQDIGYLMLWRPPLQIIDNILLKKNIFI
jgi:hypothetical protein